MMGLILAILIALGSTAVALLIVFAGGMRTTGGTDDDANRAIVVFIGGMVLAAVLAFTHWHPIHW